MFVTPAITHRIRFKMNHCVVTIRESTVWKDATGATWAGEFELVISARKLIWRRDLGSPSAPKHMTICTASAISYRRMQRACSHNLASDGIVWHRHSAWDHTTPHLARTILVDLLK
jgi:hypothetical protein